MAHQHLHLKEDISSQSVHTHSKEVQVSLALIGTLSGGMLLLSSIIARYVYGSDSFNTEFLTLAGAILLSLPIIIHAVKCLIQGHTHMDELVALAILASFATQNYITAGIVAFFMLISNIQVRKSVHVLFKVV